MMGSYASQLDAKQRWMVIAHIKKTQAANGGDAFTMGASTTPVADSAHAVAVADTTHAAAPVAANTPAVKSEGHKKTTHRKNRR